ncbi:hypothetical protein BGZ70_007719 [Mortierella alpina]|uniref:lipoyl(octanoyl) transferase n=1 Tax=Mortierella alpina TaxID=64518 RepID=A0A9P6J5N8_MORAP|nr:hypothetical protein BGZ70_007719 [Mortierella alpina]
MTTPLSPGRGIQSDSSVRAATTAGDNGISSSGSAVAGVCPTTIARPRLSPLPFIYLRNLPYNRSSDLQQLLVDRQIRLRKDREDQRKTTAAAAVAAKANLDSDISFETPMHAPALEEDGRHDLLLLVEHTPTYTNGRRNRGVQAISDQEAARLRRLGATYVESLRGGEITFHGPGQLVAYPILDLKPIKLSVRCYVSYLEKAIIATCAQWGVKAITTDNTGVWINDQKKIAAIGVHVQRYITSHGLALNCNTDLDFFKEIVACGLTGKETTSLARELKSLQIDVGRVIPSFLKGFGSTFNRELVPLTETDPDLERRIQEYVRTGTHSLLDV